MNFVLFYHSLVSDWNHGNAHFLRGVARELLRRGHRVSVYEPRGGWSRSNLARQHPGAARAFRRAFPTLRSELYEPARLDLERALQDADVVLAHEWNAPELIRRLCRRRAAGGRFRLLFHDTHHRGVSRPDELAAFALDGFDGVLAFGEALRQRYLARGWSRRVWTWHEAADTALFRPRPGRREGDLVWIGNWGDGERGEELRRFLVAPARELRLKAAAYGVRYPRATTAMLAAAGIDYRGWLANHRAPAIFARFAATLHVPRRPYVEALPGIPTIRMFEALACGIPLIAAGWRDAECLFGADDFLRAQNGREMRARLRALLADAGLRDELAANGLRTIRARHTCGHRVDELLAICVRLGAAGAAHPKPAARDAGQTRRVA